MTVDAEYDYTEDDIGPPDPLPTVARPIEEQREDVRRGLAYALVALFGAVLLVSLVAVVTGWADVDDVKSILEVLVPPLVALTGSALGFYFAGERTSAR